jgi:hypothetical protein
VQVIVFPALELIVLLSAQRKEIATHTHTFAIKCVWLVHGVPGLTAVLNMVGVNAAVNERLLKLQLAVKFAHNCTKLTDAIMNLL